MGIAELCISVFTIIVLLAAVSFVYIGIPPKGGGRLKFKNKKTNDLLIPRICVLTGEIADEFHPLRMFTASPDRAVKTEIQLPFSTEGWASYNEAYPLSLKSFYAGFNMLMRVPLIGAYTAIFVWLPLFGFFAGLIAIIDLFRKKRRLVVLKNIVVKDGHVTKIHIAGVHKRFIAAFLEANSG